MRVSPSFQPFRRERLVDIEPSTCVLKLSHFCVGKTQLGDVNNRANCWDCKIVEYHDTFFVAVDKLDAFTFWVFGHHISSIGDFLLKLKLLIRPTVLILNQGQSDI